MVGDDAVGEGEQFLQRVVITRKLRSDGIECYRVDHEDVSGHPVPWLDALGLLEAAKFEIWDQNREDYRD